MFDFVSERPIVVGPAGRVSMSSQPALEQAPASQAYLEGQLQELQHIFNQGRHPDLATRQHSLKQLEAMLLENSDAICHAINQDFGHRSRDETRLIELFPALSAVRHSRKHLKRWLKPQQRQVSWWFAGARNRVQAQPLGVVGIVVPWNYPLLLAIGPLVDALAAGNRVMIKMSEHSLQLSELLAELTERYLGREWVRVVSDPEAELGPLFSTLAFDHLVFTGSTPTGRRVMQSASVNLTPVTLELGGKSPVLIADDYPIDKAAQRIMMGKSLNAGQTCVAPDYVLLPAGKQQAFVDACRHYCQRHLPQVDNDAYTSIIHRRFYERLDAMTKQAKSDGAEVVVLQQGEAEGKYPLSVILNPALTSQVMREEIFGPLLPVLEYQKFDSALKQVNQADKPLALYLFSDDSALQQRVIGQTLSGGVALNDVLMHVGQHDLPFGGVGPSGMGHYHGRDGFLQFSKLRPVFKQARLSAGRLMRPPYGRLFQVIIDRMLGK